MTSGVASQKTRRAPGKKRKPSTLSRRARRNACARTTPATELRAYRVTQAHVERLETRIDAYAAQCRPIEYFILPGGSRLSAMLHVCRTAARRTERRVIALERAAEQMNPVVKIYLNRLSDLLFVLARAANARAGAADVCYVRSKKAFR